MAWLVAPIAVAAATLLALLAFKCSIHNQEEPMMNHRLALLGLAAGGGLMTAAFLQVATVVAAPGDEAFTIGGTTFDPMTASGGEGFDLVGPLNTAPPLLTLGGGSALGLQLAPQSFDVYSGTGSSAAALGSIETNETVANLFGLSNTEFTVTSVAAADGVDASKLPAVGTAYDVFNLGNGTYNVYTATPGEHGTVTDTLVTKSGNTDLSSLFGGMNAANPLQPGDAFTGLQASTGAGGDDAFAIGDTTFDPFTGSGDSTAEGFAPVNSLASAPPLLNAGGGTVLGTPLSPQDFDVFDGTDKSASELGSIATGIDATNLLGLPNTQFVVTAVEAADGVKDSQLPALGTVYDALNLGNGWENVYTAVPGEHGTVTDTLVTPLGNLNLDWLFGGINAANPLQPGDAFIGLVDTHVGKDAFTIGSTTFDPFTGSGDSAIEGFSPIPSLLGAAPLLNIGGVTVGLGTNPEFPPLNANSQSFDVYDAKGADLGSVNTNIEAANLLGLTNTEFNVTAVDAADGVKESALPAVGTTYDVLNLGNGYENVYMATPGDTGTVTDTLVTPFGNVDLSSLFGGFNAANPIDPGDAFTGLDGFDAAPVPVISDPLAFLGL